MDRLLRAWSPWAPADALRWLVVGVVGHLVCFGAWWVASREESFDEQVPWATVAVAGFAIAAYADITWLLQGRFALIQRRTRLLPDDDSDLAQSIDTAPGAMKEVVAGHGSKRFHRPDCELVRGKGWPRLERAAAESHGREPCGVCEP